MGNTELTKSKVFKNRNGLLLIGIFLLLLSLSFLKYGFDDFWDIISTITTAGLAIYFILGSVHIHKNDFIVSEMVLAKKEASSHHHSQRISGVRFSSYNHLYYFHLDDGIKIRRIPVTHKEFYATNEGDLFYIAFRKNRIIGYFPLKDYHIGLDLQPYYKRNNDVVSADYIPQEASITILPDKVVNMSDKQLNTFITFAFVFMIGLFGASSYVISSVDNHMNYSNDRGTIKTNCDIELTDRQIEILENNGMETFYCELSGYEQHAIDSVEEMLQYVENKYSESFSYAGYTSDEDFEKEYMYAYPTDGNKETDKFVIMKRGDEIIDNYKEEEGNDNE